MSLDRISLFFFRISHVFWDANGEISHRMLVTILQENQRKTSHASQPSTPGILIELCQASIIVLPRIHYLSVLPWRQRLPVTVNSACFCCCKFSILLLPWIQQLSVAVDSVSLPWIQHLSVPVDSRLLSPTLLSWILYLFVAMNSASFCCLEFSVFLMPWIQRFFVAIDFCLLARLASFYCRFSIFCCHKLLPALPGQNNSVAICSCHKTKNNCVAMTVFLP